jgi:MFS family permease
VWYGASALLALEFAREELYVGMLFALFALAGGIATVYLGRRSDRRGGRTVYARAGALLSVPAILAAACAPGWETYAVAMAGANFALNVCVIFIFTMSSDRMEADQPSAVLTRELLLNAGRVAGGLACAAALYATSDLRLAFSLSAAFIAMAALAR